MSDPTAKPGPDVSRAFADTWLAGVHRGQQPPPVPPGFEAKLLHWSDLGRTVREHAGYSACDRVRLPDGSIRPAAEVTVRELLGLGRPDVGPVEVPQAGPPAEARPRTIRVEDL